MTITVQDGTARAVFSDAPTAVSDARGLYITVETDDQGGLVAVSWTSQLVAQTVVKVLTREHGMSLSEQELADVLAALAP